VLAHDFITHHTEDFEAFARDLEAESWEAIVRRAGISREQIREAARSPAAPSG
jgi:anaerobic selenocysteine-containing dehydrogenase